MGTSTVASRGSRVKSPADLARRLDPEVLATAAREERVLVTHDQKTMPDHFADFIAKQTSSGVLVIPQHVSILAHCRPVAPGGRPPGSGGFARCAASTGSATMGPWGRRTKPSGRTLTRCSATGLR
ncbi:MAG: DUF5615 family PIN-like protein [Pirellulales bacterium]|nr:DUF5615 family PIN-like protein [Pirellulales bacterium]